LCSRSLLHLSPLKREIIENTDFVILRENCGGAYFGPKTETDEFASDSWEYSRAEIERVARVAGAIAQQHEPPLTVTSADKANVLASGRLWRKVVSEVFAREFPHVPLKHQLVDGLAMLMIKDPQQFNGVVVTDNTFGDMLSDEAGGLTGSLGLLPSASLCGVPPTGVGEPTGAASRGVNGIYEPVHGSAPDIAGQGKANPVGQILSLALMLRYSFGMLHEAEMVEKSVEKVLDGHDIGGMEIRTSDLGGKASTSEVGDAVCAVLKQMLSTAASSPAGVGLTVPSERPGQTKRLSMVYAEAKKENERPRSAHKDENLEWERRLQAMEAEGLPRHEPLAL
jgi:3-isopropylmalate dehydrogenase